ncbi:MAG: tyrosine-type recombinase/integrase, partial [Deltaproteobacteria bacterium]|nr:tyrosine-type recombinase/integrase [Deltaproteobacteria bacterium]
QTAWENTLKRAGITRRIRPYDLRHFFATQMIAAGVDLGTVAHLMGHTGTTMLLQHYQHVLSKQKKAAVEALPDVPGMCPAPCARKLKALTGGRKDLKSLERETGFEPATFSLGS